MPDFEPGFSSINRIIKMAEKLESIRTGYKGFNMSELAKWLEDEAPHLKTLALDTKDYMKEILETETPVSA